MSHFIDIYNDNIIIYENRVILILHVNCPFRSFSIVDNMSGTSLNTWGVHCLKEAKERAFKLGSLVDCKSKNETDLLNCLYAVSAFNLVNATDRLTMASERLRRADNRCMRKYMQSLNNLIKFVLSCTFIYMRE